MEDRESEKERRVGRELGEEGGKGRRGRVRVREGVRGVRKEMRRGGVEGRRGRE